MKILLVFLAAVIAGCATVVPAPSTVLVPAPDQVPGPGPEFGPPLGPGPGPESAPLPAPPAHTENLAIAGLLIGARTESLVPCAHVGDLWDGYAHLEVPIERGCRRNISHREAFARNKTPVL